MRHIKKGPEPKEWLRFRKQKLPEPRFDDGPKASGRTALLAEQGHICCYCMRRIHDASWPNSWSDCLVQWRRL